jgi:hypothetical protein
MPAYQRGARGEEVALVQSALKHFGVYPGPVDGSFGGGTEAAIRQFQHAEGLTEDGVVGPDTWTRLIGGPRGLSAVPVPALAGQPLAMRCLALTGSFETDVAPPDCFAGVSGNFDGQGMSFGVLQWNLGQGSLQPLLSEFMAGNAALCTAIFGPYEAELRAMLEEPPARQVAWGRSITAGRGRVAEPWRGLFKTLGRRPECQAVQVAHAQGIYARALALCRKFALRSERAVALMFDICTQDGDIGGYVEAAIRRDVAALPRELPHEPLETAALGIIATRRAMAASPEWVADVLDRKLAIANGAGAVHGNHYDLAAQYGIGLDAAPGL